MSKARELADSADNNLDSISVDASGNVTANRLSTDGSIVTLQKDGTTVGSIGVASNRLQIGTNSNSAIFFDSTNTCVAPSDLDGASDAVLDLGKSSGRWQDLYLSGGVYLGGTGSANYLDDYEEGDWTPQVWDLDTGGNQASTTSATGEYTKVGRVVHLYGRIVNISVSGITGVNKVRVRNLPFTPDGIHNFEGTCRMDNVTFNGWVVPLITSNVIQFYEMNSGASDTTIIFNDISQAGYTDIFFSMTYRTNS